MVAPNGMGAPQHSTYQQYKKNTSTLIRWIVTTASSCTAPVTSKPINNNPKHKKKAAKTARTENAKAFPSEVSTAKLVSLSIAIAEAGQPVPDAIYALFDSVIGARTAAHDIWKALSIAHPDPDVEKSNQGHWAFIEALQSAFDALGGTIWSQGHEEERKAKRKVRDEERSRALARLKSEAGPEGVDPAFEFLNKFDGLDVQSLPVEDEAALEKLAMQGILPTAEVAATEQPAVATNGKRKGKSSRVATEPLDNYKVKSETEAYFAVCFFVRDIINLRKYMINVWRQVGLGQLHCAVAGALSNMAVGIMRSLQYELAMDYPACTHFREIVNQLVRNGNYDVIGATAPSNTTAKSKMTSKQVSLNAKGDMGAIEESLLLTTHNDLVSFITDYRKNRNGKPSSTFAKMNWNPNFRDTQFTLATEMTPQNIRKWKADYTVSWLYDLVNTYAMGRLIKDKSQMQNPEKLDWNFEGSGKSEWTNRPLWGPMDFARDLTFLAMQKPGAPIESELKPHHVLQLQIAVDSMFSAKRWVAQDVPPIDCFGSTSSTLVWDFVNDVVEVRRFREQWTEATELLLEEFKKDRDRKGDPTEWSHPIINLDIMIKEAFLLGMSPLDFLPEAPRSLFSKSSENGLWLYSPYLCGTGMVEMLNMSYDWGTKCWDRSGYMQGFFHLYNMLLRNGHIKRPIDLLERIIEIFKDDIFRGGQRPTKKFFDTLKLSLNIRAQYLGDSTKLRRRKGGAQAEGSIFRDKGKPNDHTLYTKQSKLFALSQANWLVSKLDQSRFPSLAARTHSATEFLDALKSDLIEDMTGRAPVATLNYNLLLRTASVIYYELDKVTKDMPSVKAILAEIIDGSKTSPPGMHDKILTLAFSSPAVKFQEVHNERLDSPILARMGSHLSKMWDRMGPELERSCVYGEEAGKIPERVPKDIKPGNRKILAEGAQGAEFLRSKKMQEMKEVSPQIYESLVAAAARMEVGSCADCEHCRRGVKIDTEE
ncbi:MAG: hypothetical protein ALECFALPRED_001335 [Alectoria fallacina]|uniref:DUF6604 domain-containing protein n=1 Tax=Alectoria fallacina TaxID=1903189 RepID=A0A8H3JB70_9LECA|nr:MAG: hypothetical protein ALECFALPRED_001335 [Alectoria fallacina]